MARKSDKCVIQRLCILGKHRKQSVIKTAPNIVQTDVPKYLVVIKIIILCMFILHLAANQTYIKDIRENTDEEISQISEMK
jgi:hypothetical protein